MNIQTAKELLYVAALADDAIIMEGAHGIGKSNIVKQFAKENDYHLEELFLSHQEVGDLIGIPEKIEIDGISVTTWSVPVWLNRLNDAAKNGKKCVLFLDELNRAPNDVRQSALQLVLERKIHEHSLPIVNGERTLVVSAINPADDYQVDELDPALLDRFMYIEVEADAVSWIEYARDTNTNQIVRDFISEYPNRLHWTPEDGGVGATPRSWSKLGDIMDVSSNFSTNILMQAMKSKVGAEIAAQFFSYYTNYVDVVKVQDIEECVAKYENEVSDIVELGEKISKLIESTEAIQKSDLAHQLAEKHMDKDTILPLLAYLYGLEVEICVSFLKSYRNSEPNNYKKLARIDGELNNKKLFSRIIKSAEKE